jgi:hypothetical protein
MNTYKISKTLQERKLADLQGFKNLVGLKL